MTVHTQHDVVQAIASVIRVLDREAQRLGDRVLSADGTSLRLWPSLPALFGLRFASGLDASVAEVIMTHGLTAERIGPGSFVRFLTGLHRQFIGATGGQQHRRPTTLSERRSWAVKGDLVRRLVAQEAAKAGDRVGAATVAAVDLAGFGGKVIVERTGSTVVSVELVRGYTFDVRQAMPLDVTLARPRVVCIDGFIESVSEVHHLLETAATLREPVALFVRGASDDVVHTLRVNYDRKTMVVVPIIVDFDLQGMNSLVDVAVVAGTDVVSSLKGELISCVDLGRAPTVDRIILFRNKATLTSSSTYHAVAAHVGRLRHRRADEPTDDVCRLLDDRIRSLTPNHVVVRLPDDRDFVVASQAIDRALRTMRSVVDHGVTDDGEAFATEATLDAQVEQCARTLRGLGAVVMP